MNIKKYFGVALAAMCALVMTTTLTACGSDDDDSKSGGNTKKAAAASMTVSLTVDDDLLNYFDLTVDYYDATGNIQSEPLKESKWEKTVKASLPATLGVRVRAAQLKDGIDPTTIDRIDVKSSISYVYNILDANDEKLNYIVYSYGDSYGIHGTDIPEWLNNEGQKIKRVLYTFDANGNYSEGSWK